MNQDTLIDDVFSSNVHDPAAMEKLMAGGFSFSRALNICRSRKCTDPNEWIPSFYNDSTFKWLEMGWSIDEAKVMRHLNPESSLIPFNRSSVQTYRLLEAMKNYIMSEVKAHCSVEIETNVGIRTFDPYDVQIRRKAYIIAPLYIRDQHNHRIVIQIVPEEGYPEGELMAEAFQWNAHGSWFVSVNCKDLDQYHVIDFVVPQLNVIHNQNEPTSWFSCMKMNRDWIRFNSEMKHLESEKSHFGCITEKSAMLSKCLSRQVAAMAVQNGRIIATGVNGTSKGAENCDEHFKKIHAKKNIETPFEEWIKTEEWRLLHREWSRPHEIHAEQSMLVKASQLGVSIEGCDVYVMLQPCADCSKLLAACKPKRVFYVNPYDYSCIDSKDVLNECGIYVQQLDRNW